MEAIIVLCKGTIEVMEAIIVIRKGTIEVIIIV